MQKGVTFIIKGQSPVNGKPETEEMPKTAECNIKPSVAKDAVYLPDLADSQEGQKFLEKYQSAGTGKCTLFKNADEVSKGMKNDEPVVFDVKPNGKEFKDVEKMVCQRDPENANANTCTLFKKRTEKQAPLMYERAESIIKQFLIPNLRKMLNEAGLSAADVKSVDLRKSSLKNDNTLFIEIALEVPYQNSDYIGDVRREINEDHKNIPYFKKRIEAYLISEDIKFTSVEIKNSEFLRSEQWNIDIVIVP